MISLVTHALISHPVHRRRVAGLLPIRWKMIEPHETEITVAIFI